MIRLFRFSPARLALLYVALSVLALGLFAIPLWYVWRANYSILRIYVRAKDVQSLVDVFDREGPKALADAIEAGVRTSSRDEFVLVLGAMAGWMIRRALLSEVHEIKSSRRSPRRWCREACTTWTSW